MNNLRKIISAIVVMITCNLSAQTRILFSNDFGEPPTNLITPNDNAGIRKRWQYMPIGSNTFVFADKDAKNITTPGGEAGYSEAKQIDNNFYAVVGPKYIYTSIDYSAGWLLWSDNGNIVSKGDATDGHDGNGGAMIINAGTTLADFSLGFGDLQPGKYYKLTYKLFVNGSTVKIRHKIISPSGNSVSSYIDSPDDGQNAKPGSWVEQEYWFYFPSTCGTDVYEVAVQNNNASNNGNDYAIDDLKFEEYDTAPSNVTPSTITCEISEPKAMDDEKLGNIKGSSVSLNIFTNDILSDQITPATNSNTTFKILIPMGAYKNPWANEFIVNGEGTWSYNTAGDITFVPTSGFTGNPTPFYYTITDNATGGTSNKAKITITYSGNPEAVDDNVASLSGVNVSIDIFANDKNSSSSQIDVSTVNSVTLINPFTLLDSGNKLIIEGEGTWTVDSSTKKLTFTPETGFTDAPTPIQYYFTDTSGNNSNKATVTITVTGGGTTPTPGTSCTKTPNTTTATSFTNVGVSAMSTKLENWPTAIPNGFLALESSTKGFVITRTADVAKIVEAKEGMIVYDTTEKCVKLYNGTIWHCIEKSCNE
ncbi:hypothetical protein [Empedobacter falsenii]